ncbi:MAG TPA: DUF362 domain-containing protein [Armatimonadota bacterium]|jgi:hypothetical protein
MSNVYFASARVQRLEANSTLPAKLQRVLEQFPLKSMVGGKLTAVKMHLGGHLGYTTIHPLFVRVLVQALKDAGADVFITDSEGAVRNAKARGYTEETLGAPLVSVSGFRDGYRYSREVDYRTLKEIQIAGYVHDAEAFVDFSHVKGHGACAYGGACKNISMGCVTGKTRADIHHLEGGMTWDAETCTHCGQCVDACRHGANKFNDRDEYEVFYHNCVYCQHCVNACPTNALTLDMEGFQHFQEGMALCTKTVLDTFESSRTLFVNLLANITMFCDCWGFSTPALVPDIGLVATTDLVAAEQASLDLIKVEDFLPSGLPSDRALGEGEHLLQKIHGKDPFVQVAALERHGLGSRQYELVEVA